MSNRPTAIAAVTCPTISAKQYAVFLICDAIDQFGHNAVFAHEIGAALAESGLRSEVVDYRRDIQRVHSALRDEDCIFFICFNGFGCELSLANQAPGELFSAFGYHGKMVFDLMHDCPTHESVVHQMRILDNSRHVLMTDYGYIQEAQELGFPTIKFVPSITFPLSLPAAIRTATNRPIQILLPMQLPSPSAVDSRFSEGGGYRRQIFRHIYETVTEDCIADLRLDPRVEARRAMRDIGISVEVSNADHRFLLTCILDRTKFARRHALVEALGGLPITVVTDARAAADLPEGFSVAPARSFRDLLTLMTEAACVLCPLPHMTGFHERALGAFTAGAAVLAAPNDVLETHFRHGTDMLTYRTAAHLADILSDLLAKPERLCEIAQSGQDRALRSFPPRRLSEILISMWYLNRRG